MGAGSSSAERPISATIDEQTARRFIGADASRGGWTPSHAQAFRDMSNERGTAKLTLVPRSSEYAVRVEMPVDRPTPQQTAVRQYMGTLNNKTLAAVKAKRDTSKEDSTRATLKDYFQTLSIAALSQREAALKHEVTPRPRNPRTIFATFSYAHRRPCTGPAARAFTLPPPSSR